MMSRAPRISKKQYDHLLACFLSDTTATQAVKIALQRGEKPVSRPCATRYFRHWRELIYASMRRAPRFNGEVEIDIGFFGGRGSKKTSAYVRRLAGLPAGRIVAKRRVIKKQEAHKQPVLGMLRRGGEIYLHPIADKSRRSLEAAVRLVVEQGATIYTDMEKGLDKLRFDGYTHHQINHSVGYVDRNGNHLNGIEGFWREARRGMSKNFRGVPRSTILLHIKEREFRYNHPQDIAEAFKQILLSNPDTPLPHHLLRRSRIGIGTARPAVARSRRTSRTGSDRASRRS